MILYLAVNRYHVNAHGVDKRSDKCAGIIIIVIVVIYYY